jgi:hypothetical protein
MYVHESFWESTFESDQAVEARSLKEVVAALAEERLASAKAMSFLDFFFLQNRNGIPNSKAIAMVTACSGTSNKAFSRACPLHQALSLHASISTTVAAVVVKPQW